MSFQYVINKKGHCRLCTEPDEKCDMVCCDQCDRWFHLSCVKMERKPTKEETWLCPKCHIKDNEVRQRILAKSRLCFTCLGKGHMSKVCRSKKKCQENGCTQFHHKLLHKPIMEVETAQITMVIRNQQFIIKSSQSRCTTRIKPLRLLRSWIPVLLYL